MKWGEFVGMVIFFAVLLGGAGTLIYILFKAGIWGWAILAGSAVLVFLVMSGTRETFLDALVPVLILVVLGFLAWKALKKTDLEKERQERPALSWPLSQTHRDGLE